MPSKPEVKILQSLKNKKFRQRYNLFLVEGWKTIKELEHSPYKIRKILGVDDRHLLCRDFPFFLVKHSELSKISSFQNPKDAIAVCEMRENLAMDNVGTRLVLDGVQDPGNMGTMIRLADWFGIEEIVCSEDTVDLYSPKVIQSSMGSFARVNVFYTDILHFLSTTKNPNILADLEGENLYRKKFPESFNLVLGNEGNGIRAEVLKLVKEAVSVPRFGKRQQTESLNVAMTAGIILGQAFSKVAG